MSGYCRGASFHVLANRPAIIIPQALVIKVPREAAARALQSFRHGKSGERPINTASSARAPRSKVRALARAREEK